MPDSDTSYMTEQVFSRAYDHLSSNRAIQFSFPAPSPSHIPRWLVFIARLFRIIQPALTIVVLGALALAVIGLAYVLVLSALRTKRRSKSTALVLDTEPSVDWRPQAAKALILLQDADRLAAESRFTEAAHLILLRSVQDIQGRHPGLVRPAFTSRDIATLEALSAPTRLAFAAMAAVVEHSVFGGRPVGADAFATCRKTYEDFAFPTALTRGDIAL